MVFHFIWTILTTIKSPKPTQVHLRCISIWGKVGSMQEKVITVKPVFKGHCDEGTPCDQGTLSKRCPTSNMKGHL